MQTVDFTALENASNILNASFAKDAQAIPDLGDTLTAPGGQASASYSVFPDDTRVPFQKRKLVGIPEALFQFYNSTSVNSHMGLMPEIERAWISIDHKLFLWDYVEGQEISSFVDQPDIITHVALVKPKQGLFIDEINSILVICTPVSVLLIALAASAVPGSKRKEIKLYATDFTVATDVEMASVAGTGDGRIFMAGAQDGNLYELHYQETESWFGKRVQLINHSVGGVSSLLPRFAMSTTDDRIIAIVSDLSRNCFYTLNGKSNISIYRPDGEKSLQHVQTLTNISKLAQDKAPGSPAITPATFTIVGLHVVDPAESRSGIQLLAITSNGVRLYFSPSGGYGYSYGGTSALGSRQLSLVHVRLPPPNLIHPDEHTQQYRPTLTSYGAAQPQPTSRPYSVSALENSCYVDGLLVAAQAGDTDGTDYILCMSPDLTRVGTIGQLNIQQAPAIHQPMHYGIAPMSTRPPLTEHATLLSIPGRTWAMAPVTRPITPSPPSGTPLPTVINELATQFSSRPRQFMILTNVGLTFLVKRRALDYLKAVLEELQSEGNAQPIMEFRDSFGRDQTCAILLGLASGNTFLDSSDEPNSIGTISPDMAAVAKQVFYDFGERPTWTERVTYGTTDNHGTAAFSGRREGLALYLARLVWPLWKTKLTTVGPSGIHRSTIADTTLVSIQKNVFALKDFLDKNPHLFQSSPADTGNARAAASEQEAWKAEQASVSELLTLATRIIEALSFVLLLNDYKLGDLVAKCDPETQKMISTLTYQDLITTQNGMTISRGLVNVIIDQQIGQQISVDTISEVLQHRCGSFCSTDDVMLYKAKENVRKAAETRSPPERQKWLAESLRLFIKGARILEFEKLREICGDYQQLNYAKGAVELPLTCASVVDADNIGLQCWANNQPPNELCEYRSRCYALVLDSLSVFEERAMAGGSNDDSEVVRSHAYELAFAVEDEMFHSTLYDWLIGRQLADELLEMRPPYLEAHLRREPVTVQNFELLWQFYVKNGQPLRAAEVLAALAESTQFDVSLDSRIEYLTLAVANAKAHPISMGGQHETAIAFLTDLEEKLEVAQVQVEAYNTLAPHITDSDVVGERIKVLKTRLFTISEIYQQYAEPFDLLQLKLVCLHVSEHRDDNIVRPIWNKIFQEILEVGDDPMVTADELSSKIIPLGQRFYPSESAFPLRHIATLLVRFSLANAGVLPLGWAPRALVQCRVPYPEVWDVLGEMYESHVPPFNDQKNVQAVSSDIAVLLLDWVEDAKRPHSSSGRRVDDFPVGRIHAQVEQYMAELDQSRTETRKTFEHVIRELRRHW
ncbi:Nucleoporin [Mycena indigotica]|uniref:Nucleoporin n=1 Tax=Mycena indigotica TaxID=2126181 RepID=A0A8H6SWX5_9AGAR|nr:Nucleoporin [Mycena indigotica]KAF7306859.1 Nucleoporin [Mycena indigotica]